MYCDKGPSPIVIDAGSYMCKAGFAGLQTPRSVFKTQTPIDVNGKPKNPFEPTVEEACDDDYEEALSVCGYMDVPQVHPICRGVVSDWDSMEDILRKIFLHDLKVNPQQHPVLVTEVPSNSRRNREKMAEVLFESYATPALALAVQGLLSLYASGRISGVVLDCGAEVCQAVPAVGGKILREAVVQLDYGASDVMNHLRNALAMKGNRECQDVVRRVMESFCFVSCDFERDLRHPEVYEKNFTLPDGHLISLREERFKSPEALFQPAFMGLGEVGVHEALRQAIVNCDPEHHKTLYLNVVLSGGASLLPRFPYRMRKEACDFAGADDNVRIIAPPNINGRRHLENWKKNPCYRKYAVWMGGSLLAVTPAFDAICIPKEDYEEFGASVVHRI